MARLKKHGTKFTNRDRGIPTRVANATVRPVILNSKDSSHESSHSPKIASRVRRNKVKQFFKKQNKKKNKISMDNRKSAIINNVTTPASFPNVFTTISEVDRVSMYDLFRRIIHNPIIVWVGFIAFFVFAVFRWKVLLPLAPMLALGLLSFQSSNRFIMYLAPFIGIGLGWLLQLVVEGVFLLITKNIDHRDIEGTEGKVKRLKAKGSLWAKIIAWLFFYHKYWHIF